MPAAVQKPISGSIFGDKSGKPAWRGLPSWNLLSENDLQILPEAQHWMAERMGAKTISLQASHASLVSHPREVAEAILSAAKVGAKA